MTDITSDQSWQYGYDTGRAAERARCVAAVEAVRKSLRQHSIVGIEVARSAKYEKCCDAILAAIRGTTGRDDAKQD